MGGVKNLYSKVLATCSCKQLAKPIKEGIMSNCPSKDALENSTCKFANRLPKKMPGTTQRPSIRYNPNAMPAAGQIALAKPGGIANSKPSCAKPK